ncbi:hypothetical protein BC829DRAFT_384471, partial [Chytridium lagenaria]
KGRAGRLGPGNCYRLYSEKEAQNFEHQTFTRPEQLDIFLLSIIDMYNGDIDSFPWFVRPSDDEIAWTLTVLTDLGFILKHGDLWKLSVDGRSRAMSLGRYQVPAASSRFLIDVWKSSAPSRWKECCAVVAAFAAMGGGGRQVFIKGFSYDLAVKWMKKRKAGFKEEIEWDGRTATICKVNVYWMWRELSEKGRERFCDGVMVKKSDIEDVHYQWKGIMGTMEKIVGNVEEEEEWTFDEERWGRKREDIECVAFILDHIACSHFTHIAYVISHHEDGYNFDWMDTTKAEDHFSVKFLVNDRVCEARIDRNEMEQFGHSWFGDGFYVFHSASIGHGRSYFYVSHLDSVQCELPSEMPEKYAEKYNELKDREVDTTGLALADVLQDDKPREIAEEMQKLCDRFRESDD